MKLSIQITFLLLNISILSNAQNLDLDFNPSFNLPSSITSVIELDDGRLIIGGGFTNINGSRQNSIAFLNSDGSLDENTNLGQGLKGVIIEMLLTSDGKIIVGGSFSSYQGDPINNIVKINPNGTVDTTFKMGVGFDNIVYDMIELSDGGFLISGAFKNYNGTPVNRLAKLSSNGELDTTFNQGQTGLEMGVSLTRPLVKIGPNRILFGIGDFSTYNGIMEPIISIDENGRVNDDFHFEGGDETILGIQDMVLRSNNQVSVLTISTNTQLINISLQGAISNIIQRENSFSPSVRTISEEDEFGNIYFGGGANFSGGGSGHPFNPIYQYRLSGQFSRQHTGGGADNVISFIHVLRDNSVLISGPFKQIQFVDKLGIAKLEGENLDNSFEAKILNRGTATGIAFQADGKILVSGAFFDVNGNVIKHIARIFADGSYDESFQQDIIIDKFPIVDMTLQADDKLIVGTSVDRGNDRSIHRLNPDGSTDESFNFPTTELRISGSVFSHINSLPNGRIVATGRTIPIMPIPVGEQRNGILWINRDGSIDRDFTNAFTADNIDEVLSCSDSSMLITGNAISFLGSPFSDIIKLTAQEELDDNFALLSFRANDRVGDIQEIDVETNGNILVGGMFDTLNNIPVSNSFISLLPNGTINEDSGINEGFTKKNGRLVQIHALKALSNGWTVVAGDFDNYQSLPVSSVVILDAQKQLIKSFPFYSYTSIWDIEENENWVYLAGSFVVSPNRLNTSLARFSFQSVSSQEIPLENIDLFNVYPTLVHQRNLTLSLNPLYPLLPITINLYALNGQRIKSYDSMGIANIPIALPQTLPKGTYYIQVITGMLHQTKKIVII